MVSFFCSEMTDSNFFLLVQKFLVTYCTFITSCAIRLAAPSMFARVNTLTTGTKSKLDPNPKKWAEVSQAIWV